MSEFYETYWKAFHQYLAENNSQLQMQPAGPKFSLSMPQKLGRRFAVVASTESRTIRAELICQHPVHAKDDYQQLFDQRVSIHYELGFPLSWNPKDGLDGRPISNDTQIHITLTDIDPTDELDQENQFKWLMNMLETLYNSLHPRAEAIVRP